MKPEEINESNWVEALIDYLHEQDGITKEQILTILPDDTFEALQAMRDRLPQSSRRLVNQEA